jgi:hypothetical protein
MIENPLVFGGNIIQRSKTMMSEDFAQEHTGSSAGNFKGGGIQDLMIAKEFWLAMARNDRTSAEQIVAWLEVPLLSSWPIRSN